MICPKCGSHTSNDSRFCEVCGAPVEKTSAEMPCAFTSKKKTILISAIAGVILIGGAGAAIGIVSSNQPQSSQSILAAGEKYLLDQKYEQAIIEFQRVIKIDPMNANAYIGLSEAYLGLGDIEKALEVLREGLKKTGDNLLQDKIDELTKTIKIQGTEYCIVTTNKLDLSNKGVTDEDVKQIGKLKNLTWLNLHSNQISDVTPLAVLKKLTWLNLHTNQISDISPLSKLTDLRDLFLENNPIKDFSPLDGLKNLMYLDLRGGQK